MRKKKEGSSLITVVIIFSVLITVGTAMLSMTAGDYKMRVKESKKIENLYSSESGLDVAYDIIVKTFDAAVKYGDKEVQALKSKAGNLDSPNYNQYKEYQKQIYDWKHYNDNKDESHKKSKKEIKEEIEKIKKQIEILINEEFRRTFKNFIYVNKDDLNTTEEYKPNKLKESIEGKNSKREYVDKVNGIKEEDLHYEEVKFNLGDNEPDLVVDISEPENKDEEEIYTIKITSTFATKANNTDIIETNMRKLETTYNLVVPDYKDVAFSESTLEIQSNAILNDKVMIISGDINVDEFSKSTKLNIDGNIFVWGNENSITNKVYDKYKGGINLKNGTVNFNGEVVTGKTFNIESNVESTITGNLYAMNVYLGKINGDVAENSKLTVKESKLENNKSKSNGVSKDTDESGQVVIDNDITLKANNTDIEIDSFYGINDKNIKYGDNINTSSHERERTSSSIIVNGNKNSNIKINNKAYIMGVAHINTTPEYQTGESTGVKGNYIAYATSLNDNDKFDYYKPLQLLDEENVLEKSKRFVEYWNGKLKDINTGGIELPESTYSIGAIVYQDKSGEIQLKDSSYTIDKNNIDINTVIPKKRIEYASKVYAMGKDAGNDLYDSLGKVENPVNSLMQLEHIPEDYDLDSQKLNNEKAIFNEDNSKTIIIRGKNSSGIYYNDSGMITEKNKIVIDADNGELNAFVATAGDVIIDGEVTFNGNIIAKGNLTIQGNQDKSIKYDKDLCNRIQASNVELFDEVFGNLNDEINSETENSSNSNLNVQYDLNKFLKTKLWKIKK